MDFYEPSTHARLTNVSVDIDGAKTFDREVNGLLEGIKYMGLDSSELVTQYQHEQVQIEDQLISVVPSWLLL